MLNALRQKVRGESRRERREAEASGPASLPTPEELSERLDSERALVDELAALEEPLRSTVLLRYYEGLDSTEIARRQGIAPGTVRWRLKKGLAELRERLDRRHGGDGRRWALLLIPLARPAPRPGTPAGSRRERRDPGGRGVHGRTRRLDGRPHRSPGHEHDVEDRNRPRGDPGGRARPVRGGRPARHVAAVGGGAARRP